MQRFEALANGMALAMALEMRLSALGSKIDSDIF
jgi:hypothetical protein